MEEQASYLVGERKRWLGHTTMEQQAPCWDLLGRPRTWWTRSQSRDGWDLFGFKVESGVDIFLNAFTGGSLIRARVDYPHSHHKGSFTSVQYILPGRYRAARHFAYLSEVCTVRAARHFAYKWLRVVRHYRARRIALSLTLPDSARALIVRFVV